MNEQTKQKIIEYIDANATDYGFFGRNGWTHVGTLEYHSESINYTDCETTDDVINAVEQSIYESAEIIYTYNAVQFAWECGLDEAQSIANEFGYTEPLDDIERVATALLQTKLVNEINEMRDSIEDIINENE